MQDKICGIVFDVMTIKEHLNYSTAGDMVDGLEDLGQYGASYSTTKYSMVFIQLVNLQV